MSMIIIWVVGGLALLDAVLWAMVRQFRDDRKANGDDDPQTRVEEAFRAGGLRATIAERRRQADRDTADRRSRFDAACQAVVAR